VDETPPSISIVSPLPTTIGTYSLRDTSTLVVHAFDASGIENVEIWCTFHSDSSRLISPSLSAVPETDGLYSYFWDTAGINNGADGELWAKATDAVGNAARSLPIPITVIKSDDISPPVADFSISPSVGGKAELDEFVFDPTYTTDDLESDLLLDVRWDFEGDGNWDLNADMVSNPDGVHTAAQTVTHIYPIPGNFIVTMEVKNTYDARISRKETPITVLPPGGPPRPQGDYVLVDAGIYPIGVSNLANLAPGANGYKSNEMTDSLETVIITNDFNIDIHEVSNELYVNFLNYNLIEQTVEPGEDPWEQHVFYDPALEEAFVRWDLDGPILVELLGSSRIKYLNPVSGFGVDSEYATHPVTGVTWEGARTFAAFYGLRLPTEIEWEVAARAMILDTSDTTEYIYSWSSPNEIDGAWGNFLDSGDPFELLDPSRATTGVGAYNGEFIGSLPVNNAVGPFGTYDMSGNVSEWVKDWYNADIYTQMFPANGTPPIDPQGPAVGTFRSIRGGNFSDAPRNLRITRRSGLPPTEMSPKVGFRTVHAPFDEKR